MGLICTRSALAVLRVSVGVCIVRLRHQATLTAEASLTAVTVIHRLATLTRESPLRASPLQIAERRDDENEDWPSRGVDPRVLSTAQDLRAKPNQQPEFQQNSHFVVRGILGLRYSPRDADQQDVCTPDLSRSLEIDTGFRVCRSKRCLLFAYHF